MNIEIVLKSSFRKRDYQFSVSRSLDISSLVWKDSNVINVDAEGQYFCFIKSKNTGKISMMATVINCSQTDTSCDLITLPPYTLSSVCQIQSLPPYTLSSVCQIQFLPPYTLEQTSNICLLTVLPPYTL